MQELRAIVVKANYVELARAAEALYRDNSRTPLEHGFAGVLWAYALLRLDPHRYLDRTLTMADEGAAVLLAGRDAERDAVDWATTIYGGCYQLIGNHEQAERIFRDLLDRPDLETTYRLVTVASLAHSLNAQGLKGEALKVFQMAAEAIDAVPQEQWTPFVFRERQRLRLNMADYYITIPAPDKAEAELNAVDHRDATLLMSVSYFVSRVAGRRGRYADQQRCARPASRSSQARSVERAAPICDKACEERPPDGQAVGGLSLCGYSSADEDRERFISKCNILRY